MRVLADNGALRGLAAAAFLCVVLLLPACVVKGPGDDVSSTKPYADFIGARYLVVTDGLYAHGVRYPDDRQLLPVRTQSVHLAPMDIGGSEFSFHAKVPKGQVLRIVSAWQHFPFMKSDVYYVVEVEKGDPKMFPAGAVVRIHLMRGNEGVGADLNPQVYSRLPHAN